MENAVPLFEFYLFDNLSDRVHWATFCRWYVNYYEDIQGSILGPRDQDCERTYAKKSELHYVPTFYFCDWQDFIVFSDSSLFDIKIMYFSLHGNFWEMLIPLLKFGISVLGPKIARLFDVQVRYLQVFFFFHLIESKHGIKLFIVNAFWFVSVTVLQKLTVNITQYVLGTTVYVVIIILHVVIISLFVSSCPY